MINEHNYKNYIQLKEQSVGNERRIEMLNDMLSGSTFLPKTVEFKDIDESVKEWVEKELSIQSDEGREFPTFSLFSNQRFSEYSQSWKHVDENNNLLLDFKTVTRENNPQYGKIQSGLWNIPGDHFFLMRRKEVLDDNGSESFLELRMKQPTAIDLSYKISIFTSKYQIINKFNTLMNKKFNSCQCYVQPNGHYMPMKLDGINDESQYNIDDRQFYSQVYTIKLMAYIITEDDYRVEEKPLKRGFNINNVSFKRAKADVEIEECEEVYNPYYYKPIVLTMNFDTCASHADFTIDTEFVISDVSLLNIRETGYTVKINDESIGQFTSGMTIHENDHIEVRVSKKIHADTSSVIKLDGYDPITVYDDRKDVPEVNIDETQFEEDIDIDAIDGCTTTGETKDYIIGKDEIKI